MTRPHRMPRCDRNSVKPRNGAQVQTSQCRATARGASSRKCDRICDSNPVSTGLLTTPIRLFRDPPAPGFAASMAIVGMSHRRGTRFQAF
jgi:hypothetical protein